MTDAKWTRQVVPGLGWALLAAILAGCGRVEFDESSRLDANDQDLSRESLVHAPVIEIVDEEVRVLVLESLVPGSEQNTQTWIDGQIKQSRGQVMFPTWTVIRRGSNRYEVRYIYTVIDEENRMGKRGYSWHVDVAQKTIGPPREFTPADPPYKPRDLSDKQMKRIEKEEFSLE